MDQVALTQRRVTLRLLFPGHVITTAPLPDGVSGQLTLLIISALQNPSPDSKWTNTSVSLVVISLYSQ